MPFTNIAALAAYFKSGACAVSCAVVLSGVWPATKLANLPAHGPIVIDATAATMPGFRVDNEHDIALKGGHYGGAPMLGGVVIIRSKNMAVTGVVVDQVPTGLEFYEDDGVVATNNRVTRSSGDGLDLYGVTNAKVVGTECMDNVSTPTHPDCVQINNEPGFLVADIEVAFTFAMGDMQGVTDFDPATRRGARLNFHDNTVLTSMPQCMAMYDVDVGSLTNNHCYSLPESQWGVAMNVYNSTAVTEAGNVIVSKTGKLGVVNRFGPPPAPPAPVAPPVSVAPPAPPIPVAPIAPVATAAPQN